MGWWYEGVKSGVISGLSGYEMDLREYEGFGEAHTVLVWVAGIHVAFLMKP